MLHAIRGVTRAVLRDGKGMFPMDLALLWGTDPMLAQCEASRLTAPTNLVPFHREQFETALSVMLSNFNAALNAFPGRATLKLLPRLRSAVCAPCGQS